MPEQIGAPRRRVGDPSTLQREPDHVRDRAWACKGPVRCRGSQEYVVIVDKWPDAFQVIEQRVASILRHRQPDLSPRLAAHPKRSLIPGDVIETHVENVAGSQT